MSRECGHLWRCFLRPSSNRAMLRIPPELIDSAVNDSFTVRIEPADPHSAVSIGEFGESTVSVISGAEFGKFELLKTRVVCKQHELNYDLPVIRQGGSDGQAVVNWATRANFPTTMASGASSSSRRASLSRTSRWTSTPTWTPTWTPL